MKRFTYILTFLMLAVMPFTACTEDPEESTGSISGYVTGSSNGSDPLSGVSVSILTTGQSTTTGNDGTFVFRDMQPGSYSLQFKKSGYNTTTKSVMVVAGMNNQCDVQMSKESHEADIVINPSSLNFGTTQTDMSVTIQNNGNATAEWSLNLGDNNWLSASQLGGSIQANRTQSVTFTVNRNYLSEQKTVVVNLQAFGNSYPITISCAPKNITSTMTVEPTILKFAADINQQTFTIRNTGNAAMTWQTSGISSPAVSLSSTSGTVVAGGSSSIIVTIDRTLVTGDMVTTFIISDGIVDQTITLNILSSSGGDDPNNPGDEPNNPGDDPNNPGTDPGKLVVTNGLAAYYTLNDSYDDVMGQYDGFGIKDPSFVDGISGQAVKFSKVNESSINIPYGLISTPSFSISFWVKDLSDGLIFYSKCSDNNNRFTLSMDGGMLKFICSRYSNTLAAYDREDTCFVHSSILGEEWHHIVIVSEYSHTYTRDTWDSVLYIDGKRASTISENVTDRGNEVSYPNSFVIGGKANYYNYTLTTSNFTIDNFRLYDTRAITAEEVKEIYNAKQ